MYKNIIELKIPAYVFMRAGNIYNSKIKKLENIFNRIYFIY